jgi:Flp pilus assembly pilin Flp
MNKNKKHLSIVERAKKTFVGKVVCRMMGDENGAVMMEYVIVAVMIAAAVAVGAWLFGAQILGLFGVAGDGAMGRTDAAKENIQQMQNDKPGQNDAALQSAKDFPVATEENTVKSGK